MYKREQRKKRTKSEKKYVSKHLKVHLNKRAQKSLLVFFFLLVLCSYGFCWNKKKKTWIQSTLKKIRNITLNYIFLPSKCFVFIPFRLEQKLKIIIKTYRGDNFWELMNYIVKLRVLKTLLWITRECAQRYQS